MKTFDFQQDALLCGECQKQIYIKVIGVKFIPG